MPAPHDDRFESEPTPDESQPPANTPEHHSPPDDNIDRAWREIVADLENLSTNSPVEETAITSRPTQRDAPNRETPPTPVTQPGPRDWHDDDEELAQIDAFIPRPTTGPHRGQSSPSRVVPCRTRRPWLPLDGCCPF